MDELNSLEELETLGVSLVEVGANNKQFAIAKSKRTYDMSNEILKAVLDVEVPEQEQQLEEALKGLSPKAVKAAKGMLRIANSFRDELPKGFMKQLAKLTGLSEEEVESHGVKKSAEAEAEVNEKAELEKLHPEIREKIESLWKANEEAVKKAAEAEAALKAEREIAIKKQFIEKAEKEYSGIPMKADELGSLIKKAYDADEGLGSAVEELVKKADSALKAGNAFKEIGSSEQPQELSGAWATIEKKSKDLVEKSAGKLSFAQAMDRIIKDEPSLYTSYLAENGMR